jgi:transposase
LELELAKLFFPEGVLDFFDIKDFKEEKGKIHIYLEERNILPEEYKSEQAISKGFIDEVIIEDFPLRGKEVLLHIKRRKWQLKQSGKSIRRNWKLTAKGIKMTAEFADFLKGIIE